MNWILSLDSEILLLINHCSNALLDDAMVRLSSTWTWMLILLAVLFVVFKNRPWREGVAIVVCIALCILVADQISSSLIKPWVARFRPGHDPELMFRVRLITGRGGLYGFVSSHAANAFAVATFCALLFRHGVTSACLLCYASAVSFSRVYLAKHFPGDILFGGILGVIVGMALYSILRLVQSAFLLQQSQYYSTAYTRSGYLLSDMYIVVTAVALTVVCVLF